MRSIGAASRALAGTDPRQLTWLPAQRTVLTVVQRGRAAYVSALRVGDGRLTSALTQVEYGSDAAEVRTVPIGDRVVLATEVEDVDRELDRGEDHLLGSFTVLHESHAQCVGFADHPTNRAFETDRVDGTVNVQIFGDVVDGVGGVDPLCVPNTGLGRRQGESDITGLWHDYSLLLNQKMVKKSRRNSDGARLDREHGRTPPRRSDVIKHPATPERSYKKPR